MSSEDAPSTSLGSQFYLAYPRGDPRGLSRSGREERRFLTSHPAVEGPQKGRRRERQSTALPVASHPPRPSPSGPGKVAAGAAARWGGGRRRDGVRRRADEMRARRLWAAVLVVGALAGVGVGGEAPARWGPRSRVSRAARPAAAECTGDASGEVEWVGPAPLRSVCAGPGWSRRSWDLPGSAAAGASHNLRGGSTDTQLTLKPS